MCLIKGAFVDEKNFDLIKMHGTTIKKKVILFFAKLNFYLIFCMFWPFLMKFRIDDLHVLSSISCEFRKNWYRKGRTLLGCK
jgi:hypothetical protein